MSNVSPPKPWERGGSAALSTAGASNPTVTSAPSLTTSTLGPTRSSSDPPSLPDRPSALSSIVNQTASNYSPYGQNRIGANAYGGYAGAGYSSYSSPYPRLGGMGSMYGGGYGGMYGGGMGSGMYGGGYGGVPGQPGDANSLTHAYNQSTQATFQTIESIVGAFGGFAQMLESTYWATHSSFFAMVSVAEQFGNLRNTLGSMLGIFTLLRWMRTLIAKVTGRPPPADATALTPTNFASFLSGGRTPTTLPDGSPLPPKPSRKPFIMFLIAVFGLPYLMGKLIRVLARSQEAEEAKRQAEAAANGQVVLPNGQAEPIDPWNLDFCHVLYNYMPAPQQPAGMDLAVKKGDIVAVLSKTDPMGHPSEWWRCRARDGQVGYLPSPYLGTIPRKPGQATITAGSAPGSRTTTLKGSDDGGARTKSLGLPEGKGKVGDISAESFQTSAFYS